MSTIRNANKKIEFEGVRYIQGVVQNCNSIFHPIALENDQGNDCYIEFVVNGKATNFGVFVQIKSGNSYKDSKGYKIPADKKHLEYWSNSMYPVVGIVYDPAFKKAYWVSINDYLKANPQVLSANYHNIRLFSNQEFSEETFQLFVEYFIQYIESYKSFENFGRSLDLFSNIDHPHICYEGLKSLYSNHRDKEAAWFYIISNFGKIKEEGIRRNIVGLLSNYIGNPNIFWHNKNIEYLPSPHIQNQIGKLLTQFWGPSEIMLILAYLREGIYVGSFSYSAFLVINRIENLHLLLKQLAFKTDFNQNDRNHLFWLYMHVAKHYSVEETLHAAEEYLKSYPFGYTDEALVGTKESIENGELWPIGHF
ncbi:MAG TPA: DUF4365 domain-containing protein [Flavisolibacter sp.]|nr:DUF4365 domain-containing protein [Flavisolibacter sp.]